MTSLRLRRELLCLATATFGAAWYYAAWSVAFAYLARPVEGPSFFLVWALSVLAMYVARYLNVERGSAGAVGWPVAVGALVSIVLASWLTPGIGGPVTLVLGLRSFNGAAVVLTVGLFILWWRCVDAVRDGFGMGVTSLRFRLGVVMLFWTVILGAFVHLDLIAIIFLFFAAALVAMALARVEDVSRSLGGVVTPFNRTWALILAAAVTAVMLIGAVAVVVFTPDTIRTIMGWLSPLWFVLSFVFIAIIALLARILEPLILFLIAALQPVAERMLRFTPQQFQAPQNQEPPAWERYVPPVVLDSAKWFALAAVIVLALWLLTVWARQRRQADRDGVPELRESVWSAEAFADDARGLFDRLLGRFRRQRPGIATDSVRHIYASLQVLAAARGAPRPPDDTPYEYLPQLQGLLPTAAADLSLLTDAYVDAHYHEIEPSAAELRQAQAAWQRVRRAADAVPTVKSEEDEPSAGE
ncbi:MAG: DUF4129 domain-containing protein [Anaerolineae bacterium]